MMVVYEVGSFLYFYGEVEGKLALLSSVSATVYKGLNWACLITKSIVAIAMNCACSLFCVVSFWGEGGWYSCSPQKI